MYAYIYIYIYIYTHTRTRIHTQQVSVLGCIMYRFTHAGIWLCMIEYTYVRDTHTHTHACNPYIGN